MDSVFYAMDRDNEASGSDVLRRDKQKTKRMKRGKKHVEINEDEESIRKDPPEDEATASDVVRRPRKKTRRKKKQKKQADIEEDREPISNDDCEVFEDDDIDEVRYADEEPNAIITYDDQEGEGEGLLGLGIGELEHDCDDFEAEFGDAARDDANVTDADSGDDIWDDEKIPAPLSKSDDEDEFEEDRACPPEYEDPEQILKLGKTFSCPEEFKLAVLRYSLKTRYDIKLYRSQALKVGVKCNDKEKKCEWRCYCSYDKKIHRMQIKVYESLHCCVRSGYSKMLKQGTIAWLFSDRLRNNPRITKQEMAAEIKREYNLEVTDAQCSNAKTKIMKEKKASHEEHFSRIWDYQAEIFRTNEGTTFEIETVPGPTIGSKQRFYRLFICFKSQRDSWKETCRPIIGIDGAFLKWDIKGHLLAATGRDGDNRIVPIAWAVVEIESDDNWDWFMKLLAKDLELGYGKKVAIISDKQSVSLFTLCNCLM